MIVDVLGAVAVEEAPRLVLRVAPRQRAVQRCFVEDDPAAAAATASEHTAEQRQSRGAKELAAEDGEILDPIPEISLGRPIDSGTV